MSRRILLALAALAFAATSTLADDPPQATKADQSSTADQLKRNPDSIDAINAYMSEHLREISGLLRSDADAAETKLAEMKTLLGSLEPTKDDAKTLLTRAKSAVAFYENRVTLARTKLADLVAKLKQNPDDLGALGNYFDKVVQDLAPLASEDAAKAETQLNEVKALLADVQHKTGSNAVKTRVDQYLRSLASLERGIKADRQREALIGQPAAPLAVETWVNGAPLTDADLKGKVVLLDFWAVWCGPCIATFPHLREWNEKYADKGLVIIGLTRYYNFTWDEKADKAIQSQETVRPEDEQKMLVKFAAKNDLRHRFGIQKGSDMSDFYGVTGIPEAVVIDRAGKVRLIKVGSGDENAKAIAEMLETLINDTEAGGE